MRMENLSIFFQDFFSWLQLHNIKIKPTDILEIFIIAVVFYNIVKWIKTTRAWVIVKGILVLLVFWLIASLLNMHAILWIFYKTIGVGITAVIILFQPELRKALEQLGQKSLASSLGLFSDTKEKEVLFSDEMLEELIKGTFVLARAKTGALIVIEQDVSLVEYEKTGIAIDGLISNQLLITIFEHNTPLHDGAVLIRGNRVVAATCYLPLSANMRLSKELGTRHRAAVGISEETDSFTIVVSEETGKVSIAKNGSLISNIDADYLRIKLQEIQTRKMTEPKEKKKTFLRRKKSESGN